MLIAVDIYDNLKGGDNYSLLKPTTHYCITDQNLLPNNTEFYSHYLLLNTKNHVPYTDTAESIYLYNSDEQVRELCRRREDAIAHEAFQKKKIEELSSEVESLASENESLASEIKSLHSAITDRDSKLQKYIELYGDLD
ncbi:hypothetical protein [Butyrivibrio sp. WCD3002]|uniref:hypothetical protein n=1 Tax=Butyrivibrio sp. WCD3002 TaxID=1280676 RepID=UPI00041ACF8D|nr:hypothetical protein [Butyrivibrio sp. WCD3002]